MIARDGGKCRNVTLFYVGIGGQCGFFTQLESAAGEYVYPLVSVIAIDVFQ